MATTQIHPKVKAGGIGAAGATVLVGILNRLHAHVTPEEAAGLATLIGVAAAYLKR